MPTSMIPIVPPMLGQMSEAAFSKQKPGSSRELVNMRPLDSDSRRLRFMRRAAFDKYTRLGPNGSNPVRDLAYLVGDDSKLTYAEMTATQIGAVTVGEDGTWESGVSDSDYYEVQTDAIGNVYAIKGDSTFVKYSPDGILIQSVDVPVMPDGVCRAMAIDENSGVYIGVTTVSAGSASSKQSGARLFRYELDETGTYRLSFSGAVLSEVIGGAKPTAPPFPSIGKALYISHIHIFDNRLYLGLEDDTGSAEYAEVQVYLNAGTLASLPGAAHQSWEHDLAGTGIVSPTSGARINGIIVDSTYNVYVCSHLQAGGSIAKTDLAGVARYREDGTADWEVLSDDGAGTQERGGLGHSIVFDSSGNVISTGNPAASASGQSGSIVAKMDSDGTVDTSWVINIAAFPDMATMYRRMVIDKYDNIYIPDSSTIEESIYIYDATTDPPSLNVDLQSTVTSCKPVAIALPPTYPDYGTSGVERAEFIIYGGIASASPDDNLARLRVTSSTIGSGSTRSEKVIAVAGGAIKTTTGTSWASPGTGSAFTLDSTGEYTAGVNLFGKRYWTDGERYLLYDLAGDEVSVLASTTPGGVPQNCKIIGAYRGRLVLAQDHRWYMSAVGDPTDWNFNRVVPSAAAAVEGVNTLAGKVQDVITSFIPITDDLAFFGGDRSLWRITGDPNPLAGGKIDRVSGSVGVAFGSQWAQDPSGNVYYVSTQGDIYMFNPYSLQTSNISKNGMDRDISNINLLTHFVRMAWSEEEDGLCVFVCSRTATATQTTHHFWSDRTKGWFPMRFPLVSGSANIEPTSVTVLDTDVPGDRGVLIGCIDGHVRQYDETRINEDDVHPIRSAALLGPYGSSESGKVLRLVCFQITLAEGYSGCDYELYSGATAESLGDPIATGSLVAGKNNPIYHRVRGEFFWIKLFSTSLWGFESGWMKVASAGRQRVVV